MGRHFRFLMFFGLWGALVRAVWLCNSLVGVYYVQDAYKIQNTYKVGILDFSKVYTRWDGG